MKIRQKLDSLRSEQQHSIHGKILSSQKIINMYSPLVLTLYNRNAYYLGHWSASTFWFLSATCRPTAPGAPILMGRHTPVKEELLETGISYWITAYYPDTLAES